MSHKPFVHLHNHTEYSLLDGANRISDMVARAKAHDMPAIAITDHGVMFGCMEFYFECKKQGIKPILGMEAYVAPGGLGVKQKGEERDSFHLLLLARNLEGYKNLCKLHTTAALEGFYYRPRVDHEILRAHAKGLISSTTCLGSEVNQALLEGNYDQAQYIAGMYKEMFDEGCYFVELQDHGLPEDKIVNEQLVKIARELKLPLVVTNDAHYLCKEDADPHDVLLCIGTSSQRDDPKRFKFTGEEFYVKTPDEMSRLFPDYPEAMENTLLFAEMCDLELGSSRALMPEPDLEPGHTSMSYLRHLAEKGLKDRVKSPDDSYFERLNYELGVIEQTGYETYFLLVREFAEFTRNQGIMFGVRGSAAGSLVSYTVGITDVDPVSYDLTFERFLNPERVSMPDVDMDFEDARRDEVIRWVTEKYGKDRVAQIITFGTLGAKAAIRDTARVMGIPPQDADRIAKTIPTGPGWSIQKSLDEVAEFRQIYKSEPRTRDLVDTARRIEGLSRHAGVHAAGVVIAQEPLSDYVPLYRSADGQPVTAYEMGILEKIGLLKMDFLGLSNLTVLARTIEHIKKTHSHLTEMELATDHPVVVGGHSAIPFEDERTYEMLSAGETVGVFQLESAGMRRNIIELKPQNVRELAAMVALYRPGPMEHIPRFVSNKFGRTKIEILDPKMEPILAETYGIIVYQDQVLKLVQALAGFSLGKADILRRAMGKKDREVMDAMKAEFLEGCEANGVQKATATKVWELLLPFAGYAFNKAHAVCYAILAHQTAYLKAHYPVEYLAGLLSVFRDKEDRVTTFIEEARRSQIPVLPPDVNTSDLDFTIEQVEVGKGKKKKSVAGIRFGLGAIKGVGEGLAQAIVNERESEPYSHLFSFCERLRPFGLNRTALDALIRAGALHSVDPNRNKLLNALEGALVFADNAQRQKMVGQDTLFGEAAEISLELPHLPDVPAPDRTDLLKMEKETMGIYVSDHPLRGYEHTLRSKATHSCAAIAEIEDVVKVSVAGVLTQVSIRPTQKTGSLIARVTLEDFTGQVSAFTFGETVNKYAHLLEKDKVVVLKGRTKFDERSQATERRAEVQIFEVEDVGAPLELAQDPSVAGSVFVQVTSATVTQLERFKELVHSSPGEYEVIVKFGKGNNAEPLVLLNRVNATDELIRAIERNFEDCDVDLIHNSRVETPASHNAPVVEQPTATMC
ncbi:DNA polymerase III subunit alpha [Kamptonema cortianum]|nr:DNA polymerase III subunit alpha [Geitlerinema splendidum]MDK3158751.1 DNA polymerase III subunit alpha [Kamptonema cortianum]